MRINKSISLNFYIFTLIFCMILTIANASGYPRHKDDYINDFAGIIDSSDKRAIHRMFKNLEFQTGIEAVVVTIKSYKDFHTGDHSIEQFATGLFNKWGIGHKKENNGILFLISVRDRKCRIELGRGYGTRYDSAAKSIISNDVLPYFKRKKYSRGIYEGSRAIISRVTKKVSWFEYHKYHLLLGILILICILAGISCMNSGKTGWGWVFFTAAGVLLLFLLKALLSGKSSSGFGGGDSFGGGASGSW